jgi:ribosomal protein S3
MATADEFGRISAVLSVLVPDAEISGIEVEGRDGGRRVVTVWTRDARHLVGPRGTTAEGLRAALAARLGDDQLQLNIAEPPVKPPPDARPPDGPDVMYPPE